jgi:hypothetical protein
LYAFSLRRFTRKEVRNETQPVGLALRVEIAEFGRSVKIGNISHLFRQNQRGKLAK